MAPYILKPLTFDETSLWADPFLAAYFQRADHVISGPVFTPITVETVGSWPTVVRIQPEGRSLVLRVLLQAPLSQENVETVHKLFDPENGECVLRATDGAGRTLRLPVQPVQVILEEEEHHYTFTANLYVPQPQWEADEEESDPSAVGESTFPIAWDIDNIGTARVPPTFEFTPSASKDHDKGYKRRWFVNIANKVPRRLQSTNGLGYPIELTGAGMDIAAVIAASQMLGSCDDLRVFVDGKLMSDHEGCPRWIVSLVETPITSPTAASGTNWTDPTNVYASDDDRAAYNNTAQDLLKAITFGLSIPSGASIKGITVYVEGVATGANPQARTIDVGLTKDGSTLAGNYKQQVLPTTEGEFALGGAADLWGTTWTEAEVESANFGVLIRDNDTTANPLLIDHIQVKVAYEKYTLWINAFWDPEQHATVDGALAADREDGTDIQVDNPGGTAGWPEPGFFVFDDDTHEVGYYANKTATALKNCTWGCCGTSKVAHADGVTVLWKEHVIMAEFDYTGATNPPEPDDEKPVIDLEKSSNSLHAYPGPFVDEDSNRSGQWVQKYREDNDLSPYVSQQDTGSLVKLFDAAPNAAQAQYNRLELYVPCLVATSADALRHDLAASDAEHLLARLYGYDYLRGHEALLASYYKDYTGQSLAATPDEKLVRLCWNLIHADVTGHRHDDTNKTLGVNTAKAGPGFVLDQTTTIYGFVFKGYKQGGATRDMYLALRDMSDPSNSFDVSPTLTIADADIPEMAAGTVTALLADFGYDPLVLPAGTYVLSAWRSSSGSGNVYWRYNNNIKTYPRSGWWSQGAPWTEAVSDCAWFLILGDGGVVQNEAPHDTDGYISLDNQEVNLDTPPYVHVPAAQEIYSWDLLLESLTTEQSAVISFISALSKKLTINAKTGQVTSEDLPIDVPWAVVWDDEVSRIRLVPGTNSFQLSDRSGETTGIGTMSITTKHTPRWN